MVLAQQKKEMKDEMGRRIDEEKLWFQELLQNNQVGLYISLTKQTSIYDSGTWHTGRVAVPSNAFFKMLHCNSKLCAHQTSWCNFRILLTLSRSTKNWNISIRQKGHQVCVATRPMCQVPLITQRWIQEGKMWHLDIPEPTGTTKSRHGRRIEEKGRGEQGNPRDGTQQCSKMGIVYSSVDLWFPAKHTSANLAGSPFLQVRLAQQTREMEEMKKKEDEEKLRFQEFQQQHEVLLNTSQLQVWVRIWAHIKAFRMILYVQASFESSTAKLVWPCFWTCHKMFLCFIKVSFPISFPKVVCSFMRSFVDSSGSIQKRKGRNATERRWTETKTSGIAGKQWGPFWTCRNEFLSLHFELEQWNDVMNDTRGKWW